MAHLDWYRTFVALYQEGTATAAAERLFMTQPGVSGHIAGLEQTVGERLFERTGRAMRPTAAGKALYARLADAVEHIEQVDRELKERHAPTLPVVRLGAPLDFTLSGGLACLAGAEFRLRMTFGEASALTDALLRGDLDAAVLTKRPHVGEVSFTPLLEEQFVIVAPPGITPPDEMVAAEGHEGSYARWLAGQHWVSYGPELPIIRRLWRTAFNERPPFEPHVVLPNLHAVLEAVRLGMGISLLPNYLCRPSIERGELVAIRMPAEVANTLYLAWVSRRRLPREVELAKDALLITERAARRCGCHFQISG